MEEVSRPTALTDPPRGAHEASVDAKGRLKLPSVFLKYLESFGDKRVFVTSLDAHTARVYPISVWKENEIFFEAAGDDPDGSADVARVANYFGADAEPDAQGRVLLPSLLRRKLALEDQPVWLDCYRGRINVYGKAIYEEQVQRAMENLPEKLRALEKKGLK